MATVVKNVRIRQIDNSGDEIIIYPQTLDTNIIVDANNPALPSGTTSLSSLIDNIGGLAFEDSVGTNISTGNDYTALRISDNPTEDDSNVVASSKALSTVDALSVKITTDQGVEGIKAFTDGINIGGELVKSSTPAPTTNGYYDSGSGKFYEDSSKTIEITPNTTTTYVDIPTSDEYKWNGTAFVSGEAPATTVSSITGGIGISYDGNTDTITFS